MPRHAYIYTLVLEYLEKNPGLHSTQDIVTATHASYPSIARTVKQLSKEKRVKKRNGPGNSYLYEFVTYEIKSNGLAVASSVLPVGPFESKFLRDVIEQWIQSGWTPATIKSAETLVTVLSKIHQYYWAAIEHGVAVDQSDLDFCKTKLTDARDAAHKFAEFFDRLLATTDLWDARKSAEFMLSDLDNPGEYVSTARDVSEVLK